MGQGRPMSVCMVLGLLLACDSQTKEVVIRQLEPLETGEEQLQRLCGRSGADLVLDAFCDAAPAKIGSFMDLRAALGIDANLHDTYQGYALTGHSTALVSRSVSAINPRIVFVRIETDTQPLLALAFARGEQFCEAVVRSRIDDELRFYLFSFSKHCNATVEGCSPGDLLTEAAEQDWTEVDVYAEEDLRNTPRDCRACHQPDGPGTPKLLRMQEFGPPWNHWFAGSEGGRALIGDYYAAKGDETFAGVEGEALVHSSPGLLSATIFFAGSGVQPNLFASTEIEPQVIQSSAALGGDQPGDNSVPGRSEDWDAIYQRAKLGEAISVPYHDVKVTDPAKLAAMTQAYVDYRQGRLERQQLPDIRQVYPDDLVELAHMGRVTEPGLDGQGVLLQACGQCHNDRLDQSVSRANFNVDLTSMDREEKNRAIARVQLPPDNPAVMPPALFRSLTDDGRARLIEHLSR